MESDGPPDTPGAAERAAQESKPKRVRTGCLTCRERHLKCDEGKPICQNCKKSNRPCVRGVRLNFIDTTTKRPPVLLPPAAEWQVAFIDESRDIAKEYKGGEAKYGPVQSDPVPADGSTFFMDMQNSMAPTTSSAHQPLPPIQGILPDAYPEESHLIYEHQHQRAPSHHHSHSHADSTYSGTNMTAVGSYGAPEQQQPATPPDAPRDYLDAQEEVLFMQVFVEEVGLWMDSMDPQKHFSRLLPFHALGEPMLLNAFLACGARHLALVNQKYSEDKALYYYDTATRFLLESLQNPNRNTVICATTAVILNAYEIMCERALQRMNHIAGARALIKECGWNARSTGIGAACFWLNVGMELLSCLHFNWQVAWEPDDWGIDMDFSRETESGREEIWTYRIVYIVAKIANFRASIPRLDQTSQTEQSTLQNRYAQWKRLRELADSWNENIPRTMHPMAYLYPGTTISGSAFPEVWLIKRTSIVARLFYHTGMLLLAQINPLNGPKDPEMYDLQDRHAHLICGISAHVKDRGVASVAIRSLAIAAECLTVRREQEEVLQIFDKIRQETGWRVGFLNTELKEKWGWNEQQQADQNVAVQMQNGDMAYQQQNMHEQMNGRPVVVPTSLPPAPPRRPRGPPQGIVNPLLATADFNAPGHPYASHYVAPNPIYQPPDPFAHSSYYQ